MKILFLTKSGLSNHFKNYKSIKIIDVSILH